MTNVFFLLCFLEITTTIEALLFALQIENVTLYEVLEIWEFQETGLILKKVVDCLIQFKESQNDTPVEKWINKSLQCTYGRFALKPIVEKNKICENFEELNELILTKNVNNIISVDNDLVDAVFENDNCNKQTCTTSIMIASHIVWCARKLLFQKIREIKEKCPLMKTLMLNTDAVVLQIPNIPDEKSLPFKISNLTGDFKHQIKNCKTITKFIALNPVCYHITYLNCEDQIFQVNKISGFSLESAVSGNFDTKKFEDLLHSAIFEEKEETMPIQQIRKYNNVEKKIIFSLRNTLDVTRVYLKNDISSHPYGHQNLAEST